MRTTVYRATLMQCCVCLCVLSMLIIALVVGIVAGGMSGPVLVNFIIAVRDIHVIVCVVCYVFPSGQTEIDSTQSTGVHVYHGDW